MGLAAGLSKAVAKIDRAGRSRAGSARAGNLFRWRNRWLPPLDWRATTTTPRRGIRAVS